MLLYATYDWLRKARRGRLETQRKRACVIVLAIVSLIVLASGRHPTAVDRSVHLTEAGGTQTRASVTPLFRPPYAPPP